VPNCKVPLLEAYTLVYGVSYSVKLKGRAMFTTQLSQLEPGTRLAPGTIVAFTETATR
jgi:hypothetical protein